MLVDARGLACPLPVVNTKKAISEIKGDDVVTVLVDNEIAVQNLQKFAKQRGLPAIGQKKAEREYEVTITVTAKAQAGSGQDQASEAAQASAKDQAPEAAQASVKDQAPEAVQESGKDQQTNAMHSSGTLQESETTKEACYGDSKKPGMVVVLSANVMGTGDEKLGKTLMKAFVFALTKQDVLPETILLYNRGAWLSCEGSESLEDLKSLEAEGVAVMTCGTCLDFYGLKEKLAVGTVTNMYDIVETMEHAETIIRP